MPAPAAYRMGATVIIVNDDRTQAVLGKTRCSREVVLDWFKDPNHRKPERFNFLWTDFITPHVLGCTSPRQELESTYSDTGFHFPIPSMDLPAEPRELCQELLLEAERRIALEDCNDALLVRYGDHGILIDLRQEGFFGTS